MGKQVEALEDHAHLHAQLVQLRLRQQLAVVQQGLAADIHGAGLRHFQPVATAQQGAFTRTAGPDHDHHLRRQHVEIDAPQHGVVAVRLVQAADADHFLRIAELVHCTIPPARRRCSTLRKITMAAVVRTR
ncbi:hypothetical protein G6F57_021895 [Rhizopus arrhizus]|nr:hypothetical protein G6F57_021895 [Rhizopus arrhizus]